MRGRKMYTEPPSDPGLIRKSRWEQITLKWRVNLNLLHSTTDYWGCQVRPEGVQATAEGLAHGGKKVFRY